MHEHGTGKSRPKRKATVEECRRLDIADLTRLQPAHFCGTNATDTLRWTDPDTGEVLASIGYEINTKDRQSPWIRLFYSISHGDEEKEFINYLVQLDTTNPNYGGVRWWFLCPDVDCGRRVRVLHLPIGEKYFVCRLCHDLTYQSCQLLR